MRKDVIRTVIIVMVSTFIIISAGIFTNVLLDNMEGKLLGRKGKTLVRQAGINKTSYKNYAGYSTEDAGQAELSNADRYNILCAWADAEKSIEHEPMNGQINELKAINIGKKWIQKMVSEGYVVLDNAISELELESARLSTVYSNTVDNDLVLSMWNLTYTYAENKFIITIHAVTGEVWRTIAFTSSLYSKLQKGNYEYILQNSYDYVFEDEEEEARDNSEDEESYIGENDNPEIIEKFRQDNLEDDAAYDEENISFYLNGNWVVTKYEGNYYNSLLNILKGEKNHDNKGKYSYYMQCYSIGHWSDVGLRLTKATQYNYNGVYYNGLIMSLLPYEISGEIVEGFDIYSPVYDK